MSHLAASYCLIVSSVSSMVLLHNVFIVDVKKLRAPAMLDLYTKLVTEI